MTVVESMKEIKPPVTQVEDVPGILELYWGDEVGKARDVKTLNGFDDKNFFVETNNGGMYVLKVSHNKESKEILDLQHSVINLVHRAGIATSKPIKMMNGEGISLHESSNGDKNYLRLLKYVPGILQAKVPQTKDLLYNVGILVAEIEESLKGFDHPVAHRGSFAWDMQNLIDLKQYLSLELFGTESRLQMIKEIIDEFETRIVPVMEQLRSSVIHSDINGHNLLINPVDQIRIAGVIDFGDSMYSKTVFDLGITVAYSMIECSDQHNPEFAGECVIKGYLSKKSNDPLPQLEQNLVFLVACCRIAQSLTLGRISYLQNTDNEYLLVSAKPGWQVLEKIWNRREQLQAQWSSFK